MRLKEGLSRPTHENRNRIKDIIREVFMEEYGLDVNVEQKEGKGNVLFCVESPIGELPLVYISVRRDVGSLVFSADTTISGISDEGHVWDIVESIASKFSSDFGEKCTPIVY